MIQFSLIPFRIGVPTSTINGPFIAFPTSAI